MLGLTHFHGQMIDRGRATQLTFPYFAMKMRQSPACERLPRVVLNKTFSESTTCRNNLTSGTKLKLKLKPFYQLG